MTGPALGVTGEQDARTYLEAQGMTFVASNWHCRAGELDLVMLDVVMPNMGGREAYERMRALRPGLRALFASGYSEIAIHKSFKLEGGLRLLQKPYTREPLLRAVRAVLDSDPPQAEG